jgi:hypothetical protein
MSVAAELSGVQGIIRGPAIGAGIKYLGTDFLGLVQKITKNKEPQGTLWQASLF